jgi:CubicO group peptidase (beta-lactamase class C family)
MTSQVIKRNSLAQWFCALFSSFSVICFAQSPMVGTYTATPDEWLLSSGQGWHHRTSAAPIIQELITRESTPQEASIIEKAKSLLANSSAKTMALVDGNAIVWVGYKSPASDTSRFLSNSVGKTVTSMGIGKAICSGKFSLNSIAGDIVPELKETDLGKATIRDLLMMSSGTWSGNHDSTVMNAEQDFAISHGRMNWLDLLLTPKISSAEVGPSGEKRRPGESFVYRSTDPLLLGVIINKTTGTTYARWIEKEVLIPAGIKQFAIIGQDWSGYGNADGNVRMTMEDWIRFALWVKNNEAKKDCFGNYVRQASSTQIKNDRKIIGQYFDGYGYLTWTENKMLKDSYWAVGYGGQRIGWNHQNKRMLVAFSNVENYMDKLYALYSEWADLPSKD